MMIIKVYLLEVLQYHKMNKKKMILNKFIKLKIKKKIQVNNINKIVFNHNKLKLHKQIYNQILYLIHTINNYKNQLIVVKINNNNKNIL